MRKMFNAVAVSLVAAALVLAGASSAWAHHATPSHSITCESDGTYTVTESVTNSESDKVMTIVSSAGFSPIHAGDTVNQGATRDYTLPGVTAPFDTTVTYAVSWPNGVTNTATDVIQASEFPVCATPTPTPTPTPTSTPTNTPSPTPSSTPPVGNPNPPQPTLPVTGMTDESVRTMIGWGVVGIGAILGGWWLLRKGKQRRVKHRA